MSQKYVVVAGGTHVFSLLRYNPVQIEAVIDFRANGGLQRAGVNEFTDKIHAIGSESPYPFVSFAKNQQYYRQVRQLLDLYPDCKFILTNHYTPLSRFIIDTIGVEKIELWEDGLNHYIKLEQISRLYKPKALAKLLAGFYSNAIFDHSYKEGQLVIKDRFSHQNLDYPRPVIQGENKYYIGQPLIEDSLVSESILKNVLTKKFKNKNVIYLPHPREQHRTWWEQIFEVKKVAVTAEEYIKEQGAREIHSAFSTVNLNLNCEINVFHCKSLGMVRLAEQLMKYNFGVTFDSE